MDSVEKIGHIHFLVKKLDAVTPQALRATLDQLKTKMDSAVITLYTLDNNKMNVIAGVSKDILGHAPAAKRIVQQLCGKGGGRDDMAQGGGPVPDDLEERIAQVRDMIAEHTS